MQRMRRILLLALLVLSSGASGSASKHPCHAAQLSVATALTRLYYPSPPPPPLALLPEHAHLPMTSLISLAMSIMSNISSCIFSM